MIGRIELAGADVALGDVFASLTMRHGRGSADDSPLASTATLTLVNVDRARSSGFHVGDELRVYLEDDAPRFVGRITDGGLTELDGGGALSIIAVSRLARITGRTVGAVDWPEETWSDRVWRVFDEAGVLTRWSSIASTWNELPAGLTWNEPDELPPLTVQVGDDDPLLAAREASPVELGQYLGELATAEPAAIADTPDGSILVQALTARKAYAIAELDPALVAYAPEWEQTDDVANEITVEWAGGSVYAESASSRDRFEARELKITTRLAELGAATSRALLALQRRAVPEWGFSDVELLELDATIGIGSPIAVVELPAWAPSDQYLAIVEGWEDRIEPGPDALEWSMVLNLSPPRLSGYGLTWAELDVALAWNDAPLDATWNVPENLV